MNECFCHTIKRATEQSMDVTIIIIVARRLQETTGLINCLMSVPQKCRQWLLAYYILEP